MEQDKYFTDDEMLRKSQLFAIGAIGGMVEGFDYSECKALCKYWGEMRRRCSYHGGYARELSGSQSIEFLARQK